ncbi:hypothetical protein BAUCODRAFT_36807 [Baudoinia panamericana UAMH 10762]|uniref:Monopolin complex subunit Csm1/Pcs1 C-terminal domain-containing protein n=1 Tax=Baudoinia panamericana (strain UAMH 10762) TaxID=717646 RepID=M2M9N4_BAUPA|nr:uncharacterized protein BAUCODRAFT_36807 [Baudoinia panamericana UAMH 10762]EMC93136.1 hypothetical protein BAUCODRAFT_36807 [Baudoinia panamericana UAMH 10762]
MPAKTTTTKRKAAPKQSRQALKDRTNIQSDAEDGIDEADDGAKRNAKRARTTAARKPKATKTLGVIPETQPDPEDVEQSIEVSMDGMDIAKTPPRIQPFIQRPRSISVQPPQLQPRASARSVSAQPAYPPPRERSGSVSGTDRERRGGDPVLRRQLNDMTKNYENLNLKYQNLQEIGKNDAESNFEKLKRASDEKANDANALIAALKREIAELRKASATINPAETDALRKQVSTLTSANEKLATESASLKERLQTSQNEVKSLEAKLIAARQQVSNSGNSQETAKTPAAPAATTRNAAITITSTTDAQKEAKMKENLYSDLTGLIIRGVKRKEGEDEFDCIQTGRNGTLHFHLSIANSACSSSNPNPKTPTGLSYEEAEFAYEPFLDADRDRDLIGLLPDYLAEEICFPREHAVKFYGRLCESMTRRVVVEEE